jgi:hypothetical protein
MSVFPVKELPLFLVGVWASVWDSELINLMGKLLSSFFSLFLPAPDPVAYLPGA